MKGTRKKKKKENQNIEIKARIVKERREQCIS